MLTYRLELSLSNLEAENLVLRQQALVASTNESLFEDTVPQDWIELKVKTTNGDTFLGGEDFDNDLLEFLVSEFKRTKGIDLTKDRLALWRLREAAEKANIELSSTSQTDIKLPFITTNASGAKHLNITLTITNFEALVDNLIERTRNPCKSCLKDAGISVKEVDEVLFV
ncbi:hypothetical protein AAG906_028026 [Vitis piasezkii]